MPRTEFRLAVASIAAVLAWALAFGTAVAGGPAGPVPTSTPGGGVVRVAVFGDDDRAAVPDRYSRQQSGIGLLFNSRTKTVCTAFCVADAVVATAAHCLYRTAGETAPPIGAFAFSRGKVRSPDAARIAGSSDQSAQQNVISGSTRLSVRPPIDAVNDWALIRLERPICAGHSLSLQAMPANAVEKAAGERRLFQLSYHRDYGNWRLAYSQPCGSNATMGGASPASLARDFTDPTNLILHTCDTGGASSGSPLLVDSDRGIAVVGINVGTYVQSEVVMEEGRVVRRARSSPVANTAVNVASFQSRLDTFRTATILPNGPQVRALQVELRDRRHFTGTLNGRYSEQLRDAIVAFEQSLGVMATGIASQELLNRLRPASSAIPRPTVVARPKARS